MRHAQHGIITGLLAPVLLPASGALPDISRCLALFWGDTETAGASSTCITPRQGPADGGVQCLYPHVKHLALRRGGAGSVQTDRVNLLRDFQQHFPAYWQRHQHVPPVVGVSFAARSDQTHSATGARLYTLAFTRETFQNGHVPTVEPEGY